MPEDRIIWDFDGTILPLSPYDSEQALLIHQLAAPEKKIPAYRKWAARALVYGDRKEWFKLSFRLFKWGYIRLLLGTPPSVIDDVTRRLAGTIPKTDRNSLHRLLDAGHRMVVISCGTADLCEGVLRAAGLIGCFEAIVGNRFRFKAGGIAGMDLNVPTPTDKVAAARALGIDPGRSVVVGDGYSDLPLLDLSPVPIMLDRNGGKRHLYQQKNYHFSGSIPGILGILGYRK